MDPAEINKNVVVTSEVIGDIKEILKRLTPMLESMDHREWKEEIAELSMKYPMSYNDEGLSGPFVVEELYRQTGGDATVVTEVGQHQMWAAQYYRYKRPRQLLPPVVWGPWDTVSALPSERRSEIPTPRWSISPETGVSA